MYTNVNLAAPVGVLAFLGTGLLILVAALTLVWIARRAKVSVCEARSDGDAGYRRNLSGSDARILARRPRKGSRPRRREAFLRDRLSSGLFNYQCAPNEDARRFAQSVNRTRFDETTIAPWRGNGLLYPNSRVLTLVDEHGSKHALSDVAQRALDASQMTGTPLTAPLRPGESYTTAIVFELPADVKSATLLLNEGDFVTHFIIGHENSFLHGKTRFQLGSLSL